MTVSVTPNLSAQRQKAEIAFAKLQTQSPPVNRAVEDLDSATAERLAKTLRLRSQRMARERFDKAD